MASIESIESLVLDLPPSCIEFCPDHPSFFIVGTYFLEKSENESAPADQPQKRSGSLIVYQLHGDKIIQKKVLKTPYAVLDLHFAPSASPRGPSDASPSLLAVAGSTGVIELFDFCPTSSDILGDHAKLQLLDPSVLVLSLCWHPNSESNCIGFTASDGGVYTITTMDTTPIEPDATDPPSGLTKIHDHDLEAWTLTFTPNGNSILSGGDDATFRFATAPLAPHPAQWSNRNIHSAGVTAILPLPDEPDIVLTGSYDDHLRVLQTAHPGRKTVLAEENLGGGVWRLKLMSSTSKQDESPVKTTEWAILASCMHAGARIVRVKKSWDEGQEDPKWEIEVLAKFEEHKSMNYGSDVQPASVDTGNTTIVSTSFYDKLLCLWRP